MRKVKIIREEQGDEVWFLVKVRWPWSMLDDSVPVKHTILAEARVIRDERERRLGPKKRTVVQ